MFRVSACAASQRSAIRQKNISAARSCWITAVWKTALLFQHHFQKAICQNINKSRVAVLLLDESALSISVWPDLGKCRFCLKLSVGEANKPASHHSLKVQLVIHPSSIQPAIYPFPPMCHRSTHSCCKIKFLVWLHDFQSLLLSLGHVSRFHPILFQTIYYLYFSLFTRLLWKLPNMLRRAAAGRSLPN